MLGEELNSSYVTERGLMGDRAYALIDKETGKVASAKNPRKWEKLFDFHSVFLELPHSCWEHSTCQDYLTKWCPDFL
jgi:hypothetical protein